MSGQEVMYWLIVVTLTTVVMSFGHRRWRRHADGRQDRAAGLWRCPTCGRTKG